MTRKLVVDYVAYQNNEVQIDIAVTNHKRQQKRPTLKRQVKSEGQLSTS